LLPRADIDGESQFAPFNLVTSHFWVYGKPPRPVRLMDLEAAWFDGVGYAEEVLTAFDSDGDGELGQGELIIDDTEKASLIAARLEALGLEDPRIYGEVQPYNINHTVATGEWALRECTACHGASSRLTKPFQLAAYLPGGVQPSFVGDSNTLTEGEMIVGAEGGLYYLPETRSQGVYLLGHDATRWVDLLGGFGFLSVLVGVTLHGGFRLYRLRKRKQEPPALKRVYLYAVYERLWHWLQTFTIVGLLFTGLVIHKPDLFGVFAFRSMVLVHNLLGAILVVNAGLALFYHLASGEIRQFIPRPHGFFDQAITQARYYLRGMFRGEGHPFEKTPDRKLNPLQQITYFAILNLLLPLQVVTGILMWGVGRWPELAESFGGLPFLAPFHTLIAWLFAAFIVMHVYLTTTGPTPFAAIRAMMDGWDVVEALDEAEEEGA
jgi:thiosulfate reductase cytochrome b subunit